VAIQRTKRRHPATMNETHGEFFTVTFQGELSQSFTAKRLKQRQKNFAHWQASKRGAHYRV